MTDHRNYLTSLEQFGVKLGLHQIQNLVEGLGHPERAFRSVHVAGTNGKGSVTAMVEHGLRAAGLRTGRYTSPHLIHLEERFALDGQPVAPILLDEALGRVRSAAADLTNPPSFFEATTAAAFELFREVGIDVAVLEVGLGGRLDATNIVDPTAIAITAIDYDHQRALGRSLEAIAREKAGIIRSACPVILAPNPVPVGRVVAETCAEVGASLTLASDGTTTRVSMQDGRARLSLTTPRRTYADILLGLAGRHQVDNAVTAVRVLEVLDGGIPSLDAAAVRAGVEQVEWPGRLEHIEWNGHALLLDGAHNPSGARALAAHITETYGRPLPMVVSVLGDKDTSALLGALAPAASHFVFTTPGARRAAAPADLVTAAAAIAPAIPAMVADRPEAALDGAVPLGSPIVVAGSFYLVGAVRGLATTTS